MNRPASAGLSMATSGGASTEPTGTPMQCPPALFKAATNHQLDCEHQRSMHDELSKFFDAIARGLTHGMNYWKTQANFTGVVIMGPTASGGKILAPHIDSQIQAGTAAAFGGGMSGWTNGLTEGVARGFSNQWKELGNNTRVPGLMWYPAFAAYPLASPPPLPNIPSPFMALAMNVGYVSPPALKNAMMQKAPNNTPYADQVFTVVSEQLSIGLGLFFATQMIMAALGKGPVPTYAPPYVPVGPVVGGEILPSSRPFIG